MSIPAWRKIEYTDDGCYVYQCLNCYKSWEGRTSPEWGSWNFCPVCGVNWTHEIKDEEDKIYKRRSYKYSKLDRAAEVTLEVKHYQEAGDYECFIDWEWVKYGMSFYGLPPHNGEPYKHMHDVYQDYMYQVKIAHLIKDLAQAYTDENKVCNNFFMFSNRYELRVKIVSRITGETKYIMLTDGIQPVIKKVAQPQTSLKS